MEENKLPTKMKIIGWLMFVFGIIGIIYSVIYSVFVIYAGLFLGLIIPILEFLFSCFLLFLSIQILKRGNKLAWKIGIGIIIAFLLWVLYNLFINIQAKYYLEKVSKTKNIEECLKIIAWYDRGSCIKNLALTEKNESFCKKINSTIRGDCFLELAKIKKDPKICENLEYEGGPGLVQDCYKVVQGYLESVVNETADWKTYSFNVQELKEIEGLTQEKQKEVEEKIIERKLENCSFEIKYPPDWTAYTWPLHGAIIPEGLFIEEDPQNHNGCSFQMSLYANPEKEKYCFPVSYSNGKSDPTRCDRIFKEILSTFKFIKDETADWKTYTNEEYGFEMKYPDYLGTAHPYGETDTRFMKGEELDYSIVVSELSGFVGYKGKTVPIASLNAQDLLIIDLTQRCKGLDQDELTWKLIKMGSVDGFQVNSEDECAKQYTPWSRVIKDNRSYSLGFEKGSIKEYNLMLSTFNFLE
jgi:hypothetical protein